MPKPNILLLFCDEFLWNALGYAGHPLVKTPNLDRLAAESANFPHTYCASPACLPARISLFTGQYAHTHGQLANGEVRPGTRMFIETLREAGYHTGAVGKLHFLPLTNKNRFDSVLLHDEFKDSDYLRWLESIDPKLAAYDVHAYPRPATGGTVFGSDIFADGDKIESVIYGTSRLAAEHFYTQWVSDESIKYIEAHQREPFFLFVSFIGPHSPFIVPEPYDSMYDPKDIELPQTWREDLSGKPRSQLRHRNLWGVEHISEQQLREISALYFGHHGLFYKGVMYDESLRIPLLIRDPGRKKGSVNEALVS